jgi:propanediol dehydratase small subunit
VNQENLEKIIKEVLVGMGSNTVAPGNNAAGKLTVADYPLGEKTPEKLKTPTGKSINDVTLDAVLSGQITEMDVRITPETLEMQAQVADAAGRSFFSNNLRRAAELIAVPDKRILEIYGLLRPYRATKAELMAVADELEREYGAKVTADFVREAATVGEARGRLKEA